MPDVKKKEKGIDGIHPLAAAALGSVGGELATKALHVIPMHYATKGIGAEGIRTPEDLALARKRFEDIQKAMGGVEGVNYEPKVYSSFVERNYMDPYGTYTDPSLKNDPKVLERSPTVVTSTTNEGVIAHELGHAKTNLDFGRIAGKHGRHIGTAAYGALRTLHQPAAYIAAPLLTAFGGETGDAIAPYVAGVPAAALVGEEGLASLRGFNALRKMHGSWGKAWQHGKSMVPALGTYAAVGAGSMLPTYFTRALMGHKKKTNSDEPVKTAAAVLGQTGPLYGTTK